MDPGLLLVILFIVAPLIEKLIKAGKQPPPEQPPQRRPPAQRPPRPLEEERAPQVQIPRRPPPRDEDGNAVDILPEDLWAILTGQQPAPRPVPRRLPEPEPEPAHEQPVATHPTARGETGYSYDEDVEDETAHLPVRRSAEEYVPMHEPGRVVSLEQLEFDDEKRHVKFHERLQALPAAAVMRPVRRHRFTSDEDLRRAIIMTEVLGKPKGLE